MSCPFDPASEDVADFIASYYNLDQPVIPIPDDSCSFFLTDTLGIVYMPLSEAEPITIERHTYNGIPKLYTPLDISAAEAAGFLSTFSQPALSQRGAGTLIGIVDTGIDYTDPIFQNADKTTRILGIWDQTLPYPGYENGGSEPLPYYGRAYSSDDIDRALAAPDPLAVVPSTDSTGHGSALAAICGGGESPDGSFTGAAPECHLGIVKLKPAKQYLRNFYGVREGAEAYQENDIMAGILYLRRMAAMHNLPSPCSSGWEPTWEATRARRP